MQRRSVAIQLSVGVDGVPLSAGALFAPRLLLALPRAAHLFILAAVGAILRFHRRQDATVLIAQSNFRSLKFVLFLIETSHVLVVGIQPCNETCQAFFKAVPSDWAKGSAWG